MNAYFDYAATTPLDPRVIAKMLAVMTGVFGNASSQHVFGLAAKKCIDQAREQVADLIHAEPEEIIFTSGATESNNLALKGAAALYQQKGKHIVTVKTEHPSVLDVCQFLEKNGFYVTYLSVKPNGLVDIQELKNNLRDDTILVSIMHVNNETGIIQPIAQIAEITANKGILFHVDAAQSLGKLPIDLTKMPVDLLSMSAHKLYGPKGVGALYVRKKPRVRLQSQLLGGGQEQGMRSGTLATHQIVGMGEACAIAKEEMKKDHEHCLLLRDQLWDQLKLNPAVFLNTDFNYSAPHIVNMGMDGIVAEHFLKNHPALAISSGSACLSKGTEPSAVLRAMGLSMEKARASLRISFGRFTTLEGLVSIASIYKIFS